MPSSWFVVSLPCGESLDNKRRGSTSIRSVGRLLNQTSRYRDFAQFFESIGLGLENFGLKKSLNNDLKKYFSKTLDFKNFGPGNGFIEFGLPTSPNMPNMPNNEQHV